MNETILTQMYGCPVDLIAHGIPHRVLRHHHNGVHEGGEEECKLNINYQYMQNAVVQAFSQHSMRYNGSYNN